MPNALRRVSIWMMMSVSLVLVGLAAYRVGIPSYSSWRWRTINDAIETRSGPEKWWPASWSREYDRRIELIDELAAIQKFPALHRLELQSLENRLTLLLGPVPLMTEEGLTRTIERIRMEIAVKRRQIEVDHHRIAAIHDELDQQR
jgi:hypothetical protein